MTHKYAYAAHDLSDADLVARMGHLAERERGATTEIIAHLAELDRRRLHLAAGCSSLFVYCCRVLRFSENEAYHRIKAARAARRFPVILEWLACGAVNLTTIRLLGPHLTPENHLAVLDSARGKSKREVERIVARLGPQPDVPCTVRSLPTRALPVAPTPTAPPALLSEPLREPDAQRLTSTPVAPPTPRAGTAPLSANRYRVQFTIGADTLEQLELAKDLLRHALPNVDEATVFGRALGLLVEDLVRKKFAQTDKPRATTTTHGRTISAEVRRAVFLRDRGRCAFVSASGDRCRERSRVEFHHRQPYVDGGAATIDNIELRCRQHNDYEWYLRSTSVRLMEERAFADIKWYDGRTRVLSAPAAGSGTSSPG